MGTKTKDSLIYLIMETDGCTEEEAKVKFNQMLVQNKNSDRAFSSKNIYEQLKIKPN